MQRWPGRHALQSSVQVVGTVCNVSGEELGATTKTGMIIGFGLFSCSLALFSIIQQLLCSSG